MSSDTKGKEILLLLVTGTDEHLAVFSGRRHFTKWNVPCRYFTSHFNIMSWVYNVNTALSFHIGLSVAHHSNILTSSAYDPRFRYATNFITSTTQSYRTANYGSGNGSVAIKYTLTFTITLLCLNPLHVSGVMNPSSGGTTLAVLGVNCVHF
jgi:hypothetical protein